MLVINDLSITYQKLLFDKACFSCEMGQIVTIVGESGTGKTTLLKCIIGETHQDSGELRYNSEIIDDNNREDFLFHHVSYVDQFGNYLTNMTIKEHFEFYGKLHSINVNEEMIINYLSIVNLASINIKKSPKKLSTGERKRFLLAVALMLKKDIIILDEPTASLDQKNIDLMIHTIQQLSLEGITFIITTHNEQMANISHKIYHIQDKKLIEIKNEEINTHIIEHTYPKPKKIFYSRYKNMKQKIIFIVLILFGGIVLSFICQNISTNISLKISQDNYSSVYENHYLYLMKSLDPRYLLESNNLLSICADDTIELDIISEDELNQIKEIDGVKDIKSTVSVLKYGQSSLISVYKDSSKIKDVTVEATTYNNITYNREIIITGYYPEENIQINGESINGIYVNDILDQILDVSNYDNLSISFPAYFYSDLYEEEYDDMPQMNVQIIKKDVHISIDGLLTSIEYNDGRFNDYGRIYMPIDELNQLIDDVFNEDGELYNGNFQPRQYLIICEDGKDNEVKIAIEQMNDLYYAESQQLTNQSIQTHIQNQNQSSLLITIMSCLALFIAFILLMIYYINLQKNETKILLCEGLLKQIKSFYHSDDIWFIEWLIISFIYMQVTIYYMGLMKQYISLSLYQTIWFITSLCFMILIIVIKSFITNHIIIEVKNNDSY